MASEVAVGLPGCNSESTQEDEGDELPELFACCFDDDAEDIERSLSEHVRGYTFSYMLADNGESVNVALVSGEARIFGSSVVVGRLSAVLVDRANVRRDDSDEEGGSDEVEEQGEHDCIDFHDACGTVDEEVRGCANVLFTVGGCLRGPLGARVGSATAAGGGFLYIEEVHFLHGHRGRDIGLDFVEGLLHWLSGRWVLAVILPAGSPPRDRAADAVSKLARHFARLGFQQVGRYKPHLSYWFLEGPLKWPCSRMSKAEAANVEVVVAEKQMPMEQVDRELHDACVGTEDGASTLERIPPTPLQIRELVERGADPSRAQALQVCAANVDVGTARALLDLGAAVNAQDSRGNSALHVAANQCAKHGMLAVVSLLLAQGARLEARDEEGRTPLECAKDARREAVVFQKKTGVSIRKRRSLLVPYDRCISLLSCFVQQPEREKCRRVL